MLASLIYIVTYISRRVEILGTNGCLTGSKSAPIFYQCLSFSLTNIIDLLSDIVNRSNIVNFMICLTLKGF